MITFSVITITYNAEAVLQRTLDSTLNQTWRGVEHIIVDGASKDSTVSIAEAYKRQSDKAENGHRVIINSEPDSGLYDAMNKGLARSTGTYVIFMNAGDTFASPQTLAEIVAKAGLEEKEREAKSLPAVVYGDTDIYGIDGEFLGKRHLSVPEKLTWRSFRNGMLVCHQAFYARADIARRTPFNLKYRYSSDVDWCINVMKEADSRGLPMVNVHQVVAHYLREGQTTLHHRDSLKERFVVMRHHYGLPTTIFMHLKFALRNL